MKQNVNPVTLISKKDIVRIVKNLFKVKLKPVLHSLKLYQNGTLLTHFFLEIFGVTVVLNKFFEKNIPCDFIKTVFEVSSGFFSDSYFTKEL